MQDTESTYEREPGMSTPQLRRPLVRRFLPLYAILLVLILPALTLPLLNVNRFQRRIIASLSESLGRPIHLDRISLTVAPLPGFTIENLVVGEDPAFGAEPFVRASTVRVTLRVSSLWRRRVEFSRISFTDPSINLVKTPGGKWNFQSILLLQAARIEAAPTAQLRSSAAPRFPYIEATGARLNLKLGDAAIQEKLPFTLTEAEFALWLHTPQQWRLRLNGMPLRTDTSVSSTGILHLEGTLGRAAALNDVPLDMRAEWRNVPLGKASRIMLGHDAGLRGSMTVSATAEGTIGHNAVDAILHLDDLRRADFVPLHTMSIQAECQAIASAGFRSLNDIRCSWPPALDPVAALGRSNTIVAMTGSIPDLHQLSSASFDLGTPGIPAATLLDWLHIASARISPSLAATGSLTGSLSLRPPSPRSQAWAGQLVIANGSLTVPAIAATPVFSGNLTVRSLPSPPGFSVSGRKHSQFTLSPISLAFRDHHLVTLDGHFDGSGYTLHLAGTAPPQELLALGTALPQVGDGLADILLPSADTLDPLSSIRFDLTSERTWGGPQLWHTTTHPTSPVLHHTSSRAP